jgi:type II secretory pathway pseudopilin PulG
MRKDQNRSLLNNNCRPERTAAPIPASGYTLLILMFVVFLISIALLVAAPVWQTQVQRELEEELIFRGKQYVQAIRLYQVSKPGKFPPTLEELEKEKCLRRLYPDPMTKHGQWNVILRPKNLPRAEEGSPQTIIIAPREAIDRMDEPQIIGVVSPSQKRSVKIYNNQESYDKWLFFLGQNPEKMPTIIMYGQEREE